MMPQFSVKGGLYLTMCAAFGTSYCRSDEAVLLLTYSVVIGALVPLFFNADKHAYKYMLLGVVLLVIMHVAFTCREQWYELRDLKIPARMAFDIVLPRFILTTCLGIPFSYALAAAGAFVAPLLMQEIRRWLEYLENEQTGN